jgi:predicted Zn-dependent protease
LNASGAFATGAEAVAVANSQGVFAYQASTRANFQTVVMGDDASGWARTDSWQVGDLPVEALGQEAIEKAERGRRPRPLEPGEYTVIFDPYVTHDLLSILDMHGMSAQSVQEGSSWMNDRLGQPVMSPQVSIWDDGLDPAGIPMPFDYEGTSKQRIDIVRAGVIAGPVYDRQTAQKEGRESTGHGLPPEYRTFGALASNLFMGTGQATLDEMIRSTERGLYITRFWYTRLVHPKDCIVTGMTRDGVFWIEGGELAYPVKNLRFTQSYVKALAEVEVISRSSRLLTSDYTGFATRVPALKIGQFNFTGMTA